jgi:hypothetical protein
MSKLASFLKRFGPEYSEWLKLHDEDTAMSERERILTVLNKNKVVLPERTLQLVTGERSE